MGIFYALLSLALLPFEAVTVTFQHNRYLVGFINVVYKWAFSLSTSKLRLCKNRKEITEAKVVFLLSWAHEVWNLDLEKDISRRGNI